MLHERNPSKAREDTPARGTKRNERATKNQKPEPGVVTKMRVRGGNSELYKFSACRKFVLAKERGRWDYSAPGEWGPSGDAV